MLNKYSELELRIEWLDRGRYYLSARFIDPTSDLENELLDPTEIHIDLDALRQCALDTKRYGQTLTDMLFGNDASPVRRAYEHARIAAGSREGLRIRLTIQSSAPELHAVRWETLLDPRDGSSLLIQENVWFARFLSAQDFALRPVSEAAELQVLIVVANPSDVKTKWNLPAINEQAEMECIIAALKAGNRNAPHIIRYRTLSKAATIYNIISDLRESYSDILYLVCHGTLTEDGEPRLLLEKDDGSAQSVEGKALVERLRDMSERPRLVVLASCESAGDRHGETLAAIGPRLAAAGVPSVIAMQGKVSMKSVGHFMSRLFEELSKEGQIDRAVALARSDIRDQPDWWMPVLFMRLKSGRLWPGAVFDSSRFDKWDALASDIKNGLCVPVLGPRLVEASLGSMSQIARKWAERYEFPLAPRDRDDLAQVAQYLRYRQSKNLAIDELRAALVTHIRERYRRELESIDGGLGKKLLEGPLNKDLVNELLKTVGGIIRSNNKLDVHRLLAKLPVRVFVNANRDNLLRDALNEEGKRPQVQLCTWIMENDTPVPLGPKPPKGYVPSIEEPLIFHTFGNLEWRESLVLTEDDYFDFLKAVTRNESLKNASVPGSVTAALSTSGLLLLGFQPNDWDFRVLFRGVLNQQGRPLGRNCTRVTTQINPMEGQIIDPDRAAQYLQTYFQEQGQINTFWGSADDFMIKLVRRCEERGIIGMDD